MEGRSWREFKRNGNKQCSANVRNGGRLYGEPRFTTDCSARGKGGGRGGEGGGGVEEEEEEEGGGGGGEEEEKRR